MHTTLYTIPGGKCPQDIFFEGAPVFVEWDAFVRRRGGGACAMAQCHNGTMAQWPGPDQACRIDTVHTRKPIKTLPGTVGLVD